jgi:hypothetical protein
LKSIDAKARVGVAGLAVVVLACVMTSTSAVARDLVMLRMSVTLDEVGPDAPPGAKVGNIDKLRIVYDADAIDPLTHRVNLLNFQHYTNGRYMPPRPDAVSMPMTDAWLDLSHRPYRLHLKAAVVHGAAIFIDVDENTRRLTIHPQDALHKVLIAGPYLIDPTPLGGQSAINAGTP